MRSASSLNGYGMPGQNGLKSPSQWFGMYTFGWITGTTIFATGSPPVAIQASTCVRPASFIAAARLPSGEP